MPKLAYLECPTGLAGDMCLGALVDAGVPLDYLKEKLRLLGISNEYQLWAEQVHRNGQQATKVHVDLAATKTIDSNPSEEGVDPHSTFAHPTHPTKASSVHAYAEHEHGPRDQAVVNSIHTPNQNQSAPEFHDHPSRHLPEIEALITAAGLPKRAETWSLSVFQRLAVAEGAVHGIAPDQVHFHEVGATDAIVDIVGTCLGLDWLNVDQLYCSALPTGGGTVRVAHGQLPVPTPAVLKLWEMRQVPVYSNGIERELVTPTGAAIATTLATQFGPPPAMTLQRVGLGAGSRNLPLPNILRLWIGESDGQTTSSNPTTDRPITVGMAALAPIAHPDPSLETIAVLETQIDDLNPQAIGYVFEALFEAGAVDVFTQAIGMKKSRPGVLLTVICHPVQVKSCEMVLFRETSTLGIRHSMQQRTILRREMQTVLTKYGEVRVKVARLENGAIANVQPEYEDCAQLARQSHLPWREVHRLTLQSWYLQKIS